MADLEYRFRSGQQGQIGDLINEDAAEGFEVSEMLKDGNHFYVLLEKRTYSAELEEIAESEELWLELDGTLKRLSVLEGALALKIKKDSIDPPPKVVAKDEPVVEE